MSVRGRQWLVGAVAVNFAVKPLAVATVGAAAAAVARIPREGSPRPGLTDHLGAAC
jgi:hypothetical protein